MLMRDPYECDRILYRAHHRTNNRLVYLPNVTIGPRGEAIIFEQVSISLCYPEFAMPQVNFMIGFWDSSG